MESLVHISSKPGSCSILLAQALTCQLSDFADNIRRAMATAGMSKGENNANPTRQIHKRTHFQHGEHHLRPTRSGSFQTYLADLPRDLCSQHRLFLLSFDSAPPNFVVRSEIEPSVSRRAQMSRSSTVKVDSLSGFPVRTHALANTFPGYLGTCRLRACQALPTVLAQAIFLLDSLRQTFLFSLATSLGKVMSNIASPFCG